VTLPEKPLPQQEFLPMTLEDLKKCGISQPDVILVSGDAYVDHPSFATALLGRALWDASFSVGIIAQPNWRDRNFKNFQRLGKPRLFFAVVPGAVDPQINAYTPALKRRSTDSYSPGGKLTRPDRTTIVYTNALHRLYPRIPIVIGGIEASLRRFAHYDYWSNSVRQGILADAPASLLVYGMGELALVEIAKRMHHGDATESIRDIPGTCWTMSLAEFRNSPPEEARPLPSYPDVINKDVFANAHAILHRDGHRQLVQPHPKTVIVANPPMRPMIPEELDHLYELPFTRKQHPSYQEPVLALEPVQFSLVTHRGCFGGCSFCAITHHQGRVITSRNEESLLREAECMAKMPEFRGTIQDVGGPTANMYGCTCKKWETDVPCPDKLCTKCRAFSDGTERQMALLKRLRQLPRVKHVFISSGIRYDLIPNEELGDRYLHELVDHYISGHLKVAPEHISEQVTVLMNKPGKEEFEKFRRRFESLQKKLSTGKNRQYLVPYLMSSHPGCHLTDMIELAQYLQKYNLYSEQVQDFTPVPLTLSTAIYFSGKHPLNGKKVHVPIGDEKRMQRALLQWKDPRQYDLAVAGLLQAKRNNLIGVLLPKKRVQFIEEKRKK
jgi:uncharacterized radical SAM protein YgiQ